MSEKNIVLSLDSGKNFPLRTGSKTVIKAKLDNVLLQTDETLLQSDRNPSIDCELVWETSRSLLTALRTRRACVKAEVFIDDKLLGYVVLDIRSAPLVKVNSAAPPNQEYPLQGASVRPPPSLLAALFIETDQASSPSPVRLLDSSKTPQIIKKNLPSTSAALQPVLNESEGYFQIGEVSGSQLFQFKVGILKAENLHLLLQIPDVQEPETFVIDYELIGIELRAQPGEIATAKLCATRQNLFKFFSTYSIQINIKHKENIVGSADIDVSEKLQVSSQSLPLQFSGDFPIIASYNLTTPRDENNQFPFLSVQLYLDKVGDTPSPAALSHQSIPDMSHVSEGDLSEAVSETNNNPQLLQTSRTTQSSVPLSRKESAEKNVHQSLGQTNTHQASIEQNDSTSIQQGPSSAFKRIDPKDKQVDSSNSRPVPEFISHKECASENRASNLQQPPPSPPTRLPRDSSLQPGDETDYKSPPSRSSSVSMTFDYPADTKLPRKLIIGVESVRMLNNVSDLVIWYEYKHLTSSRVTTAPLCAPAGDLVKILDGTIEFNFMSSQVQLTAVFNEYKLKLNVTSQKQQQTLGVCTVALEKILAVHSDVNKIKKESFELTVVSDKGVVGYMNVILSLQTFSPRHSPSSRKSLEHSLSFNSNKGKRSDVEKRKQALRGKENLQSSIVGNNQSTVGLESNNRSTLGQDNRVSSSSRQVRDRLVEMEMLAQVAKELETWKINEQKKFKEQLVQKENQQMSLLGREWQDRERSRVEVYNNKMQVLQNREMEIENKLSEIQAKEKEIDGMKKNIEDEQNKLKQGRIDSLQKLRRDLKNKETESLQKDTELKLTREKLSAIEKELNQIKSEKEKKKDSQAALQSELRKSREEVLKLQSQLDIRAKELQLLESQKDLYFKENQDLKAEQQSRLEELVSQLKMSRESEAVSQKVAGHQILSLPEVPSARAPHSSRTDTSRSSSTRTPDTQIERLKPASPTGGGVSARAGSAASVSGARSSTPVQYQGVNQVEILKNIQRLERDRDMMLRAGHLHEDDLIQMFQAKIQELYQQIRDDNEDVE